MQFIPTRAAPSIHALIIIIFLCAIPHAQQCGSVYRSLMCAQTETQRPWQFGHNSKDGGILHRLLIYVYSYEQQRGKGRQGQWIQIKSDCPIWCLKARGEKKKVLPTIKEDSFNARLICRTCIPLQLVHDVLVLLPMSPYSQFSLMPQSQSCKKNLF